MTNVTTFLVDKSDYAATQLGTADLSTLTQGEVLLKVDHFAFTSNNITYATLGEAMRYWEFFPAPEGQGLIPVWGFADVLASNCDGVTVGERFYGYFPMATHLRVQPTKVIKYSFIDGAEHRQPLPMIYNQYIRCAADPLYCAESEALQMLLRPLFTTSFLLDDFFFDNRFFDARTLVLTSASSKTALGMAFLLHRNRSKYAQGYEIVGLTSKANLDFVKDLGCYDRVLSYDQVSKIDPHVPTASVDFAGNGELLGQLHAHFNDQLKYSCLVGMSHWDNHGGLPENAPGPEPQQFFAPSQAEKCLKGWGAEAFQQQLAEVWSHFVHFVDGWIILETGQGGEDVERVYQEVLAGRLNAQVGHCLSL